ncbi:MAG TPA: hypothetical protein VIY48_13950 [Candidatus Paceibacterota bacterium]
MIPSPSDAPELNAIETPFLPDKMTQVEAVNFGTDGLAISMSSEHWDAEVFFEQTYGFRVLDELDLTEFWSQCSLADGWFFEVTYGGWKALELTRPNFLSGRHDWVREYLVIGRNECVSVLTKEAPLITTRVRK